jgi:hypothetical protein
MGGAFQHDESLLEEQGHGYDHGKILLDQKEFLSPARMTSPLLVSMADNPNMLDKSSNI